MNVYGRAVARSIGLAFSGKQRTSPRVDVTLRQHWDVTRAGVGNFGQRCFSRHDLISTILESNSQGAFFECMMFNRKPQAQAADPGGPRTLDTVVDGSGLFQKPLFLVLFRAVPSAFTILSMTFLAPKIQGFACASTPDDTSSYLNDDTSDNRCYSADREICTDWNFDDSVFGSTFKSEVCPLRLAPALQRNCSNTQFSDILFS